MANGASTSRYFEYLPAIYEEQGEVLGAFLEAFERVLTGVGDVGVGDEPPPTPGFEEILEGIPRPDDKALGGAERYFDPGPDRAAGVRAPAEFLEWLAGWVALFLREDWEEKEKRRILRGTVAAYQKRGTKEGLHQVLASYTGLPLETIDILELNTPLQVGVSSTVGRDTLLGGGPPHFFQVRIQIAVTGPDDEIRRERIVRAIIDQEKPAHTFYDLFLDVRTMQVAVRSTVGVDTVLGNVR